MSDDPRRVRVYRTTAYGAAAVDSLPTLSRRGLLTLREARRLAADTPGSWIGIEGPDGRIVRLEG